MCCKVTSVTSHYWIKSTKAIGSIRQWPVKRNIPQSPTHFLYVKIINVSYELKIGYIRQMPQNIDHWTYNF